VAMTARVFMQNRPPFACAVEVKIMVRLPRPPSVKRKLPSVKPDADKIARSTLDAISKGIVLVDDALAVDLIVRKRYASPGDEGATITVREVADAG